MRCLITKSVGREEIPEYWTGKEWSIWRVWAKVYLGEHNAQYDMKRMPEYLEPVNQLRIEKF